MTGRPTSPIQQTAATLNPYRYSLNELKNRLKWDLKLESWRSRGKVRRLKNKHLGQKALILCNGPSLNEVDFEEVHRAQKEGLIVIGLNKINLLFDRTPMRPNYIVAINIRVIEQNFHFFNDTRIPLFLSRKARRHVNSKPHIAFLHASRERRFTRDISTSIQDGYTVTYTAMEIAFHLGIRDLALVGCDHSFAEKGPSNSTVESGKVDFNHFDPSYFAGGMKWDLPDLSGSEYQYAMAGEAYSAFDGRIINCSATSELDIYPKMHLKDWMVS